MGLFGKALTLEQNDKVWAPTKLKAFADDKFNDTKMLISLFNRLENIVAKGENAGYQHFLLLSSTEQEVLRVNHCDHSPSVGVRRPFTFSFLHANIYKYQLIGTKFGQNIYDHKISDEFDYGSNRTRIKGVICP